MTTATFHMEGDRITGFDIRDHSDFGEEGADIVCAAVSSAVNLVDATVNDVLGLAASVRTDPKRARLSFRLPGGLSETDEATCQNLLAGMMVYLADLHQHYPQYVQVVDDSPDEPEEG